MVKSKSVLSVSLIVSVLATVFTMLPVISQTQRSLTINSIGPPADPQGKKVLFWHDSVETETPTYQDHTDVTIQVTGTWYIYKPKTWQDYTGNWWVYDSANIAPKGLSWVQTVSGPVKVVKWQLPDPTNLLEVTYAKKKGPTVGGDGYLYFKMYYTPVMEWSSLKAGEIDVMDWALSAYQHEEWVNGWAPGVSVEETKELGMFQFDFNTNATMDGLSGATYKYPGIPSPTADPKFRRATAKLVDKISIAKEDFGGLLEVMDVPLAKPAHEKYINTSVVAEWRTGALKYDPLGAVAALDAAGYVKGKTANPYEDTNLPWSSDKIRINPLTGNDLYELIFYIRSDKHDRQAAGLRFADMLRKVGIPVNTILADKSSAETQVMGLFGYHIYTGGWGLNRDPDHLHNLYTADFANPYSYNYMIHNAVYKQGVGPITIDPALETTLDGVKYGATLSEVTDKAKTVQDLLWGTSGTLPSIIIGHYTPQYTAYRTGWKGMVNGEGVGVRSLWSTAVGHVRGPEGTVVGDTIKFGLASTVSSLNPITAQWVWDWIVLERIYNNLLGVGQTVLDGVNLLGIDPYTVATDMPAGLADWWEVETMYDAVQGKTVTKLTFHLRGGVKWHPDPARGYPDGAPLTVDDVKFSIEYHKAQFGWFYSNVESVHRVEVDAVKNEVYVYLDVTAFLGLHWVGGVPIIPKYIWESVPDAYAFDPIAAGALIGTGAWRFKDFLADDYVTLVSNEGYFLYTEDMVRFIREAFHRRGDVNYDSAVDQFDLALMGKAFSSLPYQSVPTWVDNQYPVMMYSPPLPGDPFATGKCPPWDYSPPIPWAKEDVNYDSYRDLSDLMTLAKFWRYHAGSGF